MTAKQVKEMYGRTFTDPLWFIIARKIGTTIGRLIGLDDQILVKEGFDYVPNEKNKNKAITIIREEDKNLYDRIVESFHDSLVRKTTENMIAVSKDLEDAQSFKDMIETKLTKLKSDTKKEHETLSDLKEKVKKLDEKFQNNLKDVVKSADEMADKIEKSMKNLTEKAQDKKIFRYSTKDTFQRFQPGAGGGCSE